MHCVHYIRAISITGMLSSTGLQQDTSGLDVSIVRSKVQTSHAHSVPILDVATTSNEQFYQRCVSVCTCFVQQSPSVPILPVDVYWIGFRDCQVQVLPHRSRIPFVYK